MRLRQKAWRMPACWCRMVCETFRVRLLGALRSIVMSSCSQLYATKKGLRRSSTIKTRDNNRQSIKQSATCNQRHAMPSHGSFRTRESRGTTRRSNASG